MSESLLSNDSESDRSLQTVMAHKPIKTKSKVNYNALSNDHDDDHHDHAEDHGHSHSHSHSHGHGDAGHGHSHGATKKTKSTNGHGHSHDARPLSPTVSPRMSPRACGGLGPKNGADQLDKTGRKIEAENAKARQKLWLVSLLCLCFMVLEIIGGFIANSLAIMTDAAHLLSDLASFLISIFALWLATRAPTSRLSFGFHRAEILGALISVIMIWLLTGILIYEAVQRIREPEHVDGKIMFIVAAAGLGVNLVMGLILYQSGHGHSHGLGGGHGHSHGGDAEEEDHSDEDEEEHGHSHGTSVNGDIADAVGIKVDSYQTDRSIPVIEPTHRRAANINVTAAFVHVLGDALQSVGVMIAAGLIWWNPEYHIADPICTFVFSVLVLFTTARLVKQSVGVLMEGAPEGIDPARVEDSLHALDGVLEVHDLHVWSLSVGKPSLSVHLVTSDDNSSQHVLQQATVMLGKRFNIHHSTIQVEKQSDQISCNAH